ncbi:MAG: Ku protein, partial [Oscillospiraceae bacterium]|nr:Ku protein [Oscillospiraceae bacterium]
WHAQPAPGGEKAFELLRRALLDEGKIAVGKTVLGAKESLMAVLPRGEGLAVQSLYFADELREPPAPPATPRIAPQELEMARRLVRSMDAPFDPAEYHDEYQARLKKLLESKISGEGFAPPAKSGRVNVTDLMEAFRQSIEQAGSGGAKAKRPAAKKAASKK